MRRLFVFVAMLVATAMVVLDADPSWAAESPSAGTEATGPRSALPRLDSDEPDPAVPDARVGPADGTSLAPPEPLPPGEFLPEAPQEGADSGDPVPASDVLTDAELQDLAARQDSFDPEASVVDDRDFFEESYTNPDGTSTVVMSTEVMNVPSESGAWTRPDDSLDVAADGVTSAAANAVEPVFQPRADEPHLVTVGRGGKTVSFTLEGAAASTITRSDGVVTYPEVFPGVDLVYTLVASGVQKEFRLRSRPAAGEAAWTFRLSSGGLVPRLGPAGSGTVEFVDTAGDVVLSTPTALMHDSSGGGDELPAEAPVDLSLARDGADWLLTVSADEEWLASPDRVYPVYVDPTVELHNDSDASDGSGYRVVAMSENGRVVYDQGIRMGHCPSTCPNDAADPRQYTTWRSAVHFPYEEFFGYQLLAASFQYVNLGSLASTSAGGGVVHHATAFSYGGLGTTVATYNAPAGSTTFPIAGNSSLVPTVQNWLTNRHTGGYFMFRFAEEYGQYTYRTGYAKMYLTVNRPPTAGVPANGAPVNGSTGQVTNPQLTTSASDPDHDPLERRFRIVGPGLDTWTAWSPNTAHQVADHLLANATSYQWWAEVRDSYGATALGGPWTFTTQNRAPSPAQASASPADGSVLASTTPTLSAGSVGATDADGEPITYEFRVATGPDARSGVVVRSGRLTSPTWTVPAGSLQDGGSYTWTVVTSDGREATGAPWVQRMRVDRRLGTSGPSPFDTAGPVTVNLANGNLATSFGSPSVSSVGGDMGATFSYNSQASSGFGLNARYWDQAHLDTLAPGQVLRTGDRIESAGGNCYLTYQQDGNLVLYCGTPGQDDFTAQWATAKFAIGGYAVMQTDGNFVQYTKTNAAVWSSGTSVAPGREAVLRLQDDEDLVVLDGTTRKWSSGTAVPGLSFPFMRGDQPVLTRTDAVVSATWSSGSPAPQVPADGFTVEWSGHLRPGTTPPVTPPADWDGTYEFGVASDDGVRMWVDDQLKLDRWWRQGAGVTRWSGHTMTSQSGRAAIKIRYFEHSGSATIDLRARACNAGRSSCVEFVVPSTWLTTAPQLLPPGWAASLALGGGEAEYASARIDDSAVVLTDTTGSVETWTRTADGSGAVTGYTPPEGSYGVLTVAPDTKQVTLTDEDGQVYVFDGNGRLLSVTSAADDRKAASHRYTYDASGELTTVSDPVTGRAVRYRYGGDSACTGQNAPTGMLCRLEYPDGSATVLTYDTAGLLVRITDPGNEITDLAYDSQYRLRQVRDSLAADWLLADSARPASSPVTTDITYDSAGRVSSVTLPSPDGVSAPRPARTYAYDTAARSTTVTVAGLAGVNQTVTYDEQLRVTSATDATAVTESTEWNAKDQSLRSVDGAGRVTTTVYDASDRVTDTYGPAPASCFGPDRRPTAECATSVPRSSTSYRSYDPNGVGTLQVQYWKNRTLSGAPALTRLGLADGVNDVNRNWGTAGPFPDDAAKVDSWSARLTGQIELPVAGTVKFRFWSDDGTRLWIDDQLVVDSWEGGGVTTTRGEGTFVNPGSGATPDTVLHRIRVDYWEGTSAAELRLEIQQPGQTTWQTVTGDMLFDGLDTLVTSTTEHEDPAQAAAPPVTTTSLYQVGSLRSEVHGGPLATVVDQAGLNLVTQARYDDYRRQTVRALPANNPDDPATRTSFEYYADSATLAAATCGVAAGTAQGGFQRYEIGARNSEGYAIASEAVYDVWGRVAGVRQGRKLSDGSFVWEAEWSCTAR
jgi:YD repeat-containing protein